MTPAEMLDILDHAIATTPKPRRIAVQFTAPQVLGHHGTPLRTEDGDPPVVYGYTRRQCEDIRDQILAAARTDLDVARQQVHGA